MADWYFFALAGLSVFGLPALAGRDRRPERLLVASGLVGLLVIPLLLWGNPRFHLPLVPFIVLCAAFAIDERGATPPPCGRRWRRMTRRWRGWAPPAEVLVVLAIVGVAVPLVVALLARRDPPWVPDLDLALTELRVRDVGGAHSPLIGLPGRLGTPDHLGSHPGPVSFYLLAPTYRLLGSTAFALQAATVVVHLAGASVTVLLVARRAGARVALAVGLLVAVLVTAVGPNLFTEPWNPDLPLLWWPAFLAAAWLTLCGDAVGLPFLVVAGAVCAQTHVPYLGPVALISAAAVVVCVRWPDRTATDLAKRWIGGAGILLVAVWAPVLVDQVRHDPGNARLIAEHLLDPPEATVGWSAGSRLALERLDVIHLVDAAATDPGRLAAPVTEGASAARGGLLLAALAIAAIVGARRAARDQRAALALSAATAALAVLSISRISGYPWGYLMLSVCSVALLTSLAVAATVPVVWRRFVPVVRAERRQSAIIGVALGAMLVAVTARASVAAERVGATNPVVSRTVLALVPAVLEHLEPGDRYLVTWEDSVHLGGHGYGLVDELERRGVDVVVPDALATQFGAHRTDAAGHVDHHLVVATGDAVSQWGRQPGVVELAHVDVRTPAERSDAGRVRNALIRALRDAHLEELVAVVDDNVFAVAVDTRLTPAARALALRLDALGAEAAVFLAPED